MLALHAGVCLETGFLVDVKIRRIIPPKRQVDMMNVEIVTYNGHHEIERDPEGTKPSLSTLLFLLRHNSFINIVSIVLNLLFYKLRLDRVLQFLLH